MLYGFFHHPAESLAVARAHHQGQGRRRGQLAHPGDLDREPLVAGNQASLADPPRAVEDAHRLSLPGPPDPEVMSLLGR